MSRPPKYSPEVQERILEAIRVGATYELAAGYGGIAYDTFNEWRKAKPEFSEALKQAEGAAAVGWLSKIESAAGAGNWQAAAWKLERRYPEAYGRQVHEMSGRDGGPIQTEDVSLSDTDRATRILAIVQRARERAAGSAHPAEPNLGAPAGATD